MERILWWLVDMVWEHAVSIAFLIFVLLLVMQMHTVFSNPVKSEVTKRAEGASIDTKRALTHTAGATSASALWTICGAICAVGALFILVTRTKSPSYVFELSVCSFMALLFFRAGSSASSAAQRMAGEDSDEQLTGCLMDKEQHPEDYGDDD